MKKTILVLAITLIAGFALTSCKNNKQEATKEAGVKVDENEGLVSNDAYKCPMDCENGKTYEKEGKCPVCNMDLKKVEVNKE